MAGQLLHLIQSTFRHLPEVAAPYQQYDPWCWSYVYLSKLSDTDNPFFMSKLQNMDKFEVYSSLIGNCTQY